jgi:hypothetical protein
MIDFVDPPIYPHIEIFPPVMQAYGNLTSAQHSTPISERISASSHASFFRRVRKTHRELHEEVFGPDAPVNGSLEQTIDEPLGGMQARGRTRSMSVIAYPAVPQAASLPPSSLPPVPPLPTSQQLSLRIPSQNAEARHSGLSTHPSEARSQPKDQPTSSHITLNTHHDPSPTRHGKSIARSNSHKTANSSPRRDNGYPKQAHRPRDSLVLEKARHFDHLHALGKVATF